MKIKIDKNEIVKKLKVLSKMPRGSKLSSKISEHVFFSVENEVVKMMVYDGREVFSTIKLNTAELEIGEENIFGVNLKLLLSIVSKLEKEIKIELHEKYVVILSGRSKFELYRTGLEGVWEEQIRPSIENDKSIRINTNTLGLKKMFETVVISTSEDKENHSLSSMKLKIENEVLELSATDGYRASISCENIGIEKCEHKIECLILKESIPVIAEMLSLGEEVNIIATQKAISIEVLDMTVVIRTRELGKYPDVKRLLNGEGEKVLNINKKEWVNAIDGISNLGANLIKIESKEDGKMIVCGESDITKQYEVSGEFNISVVGEIGKDMKMLFRNKLLIEGIRSIQSDMVEVRIKGPNDFITIRPSGSKECVNIVLPCRNI